MDKLFKVTVNGNSYEVKVEEVASFESQTNNIVATQEVKKEVAPVEAPQVQTQPEPKVEVPVVAGGEVIEIKSPMPGGIWKILKKPGDSVKKHETILILEVMKMENEIVAPQDGTIKSILVSETNKVEAGQVLAEMV